MKKTITFGQNTALLERSKSAMLITISPIKANTPFPSKIAQLADTLNEANIIEVVRIMPNSGKLVCTAEKGINFTDIIEIVCDAITYVYHADTTISNESPAPTFG